MKSEFESREAFECIFGDEGEIDLSKDETGEYSFQPSRFAYSFFFLAWQYRQTDVDELQKRVDEQTRHIEMALIAVKDIHKSAIDEFLDWDVLNEKAPKLCEHLQNLSVAVGELEQALKGGVKSEHIYNRNNICR